MDPISDSLTRMNALLEARKNCVTCREPKIYAFQSFKNCDDCRAKNREKSRQQAERSAARKMAWLQAQQAVSGRAMLSESDSDTGVVLQEHRRTSTGAIKRKTPLATHDFNVEVELKRAKGMLTKSEPREVGLPLAPFDEHSTAFQTASLMHSKLQNELCKKMNFHGHYSIVAVSGVDDAQRVEKTRQDLRKIVRLPFEFKNAVRIRDKPGYTLRFKCACKGYVGEIPRKCGGKVVITAREDRSHPLLAGQVVSVSITH